MIYPDNFEQKTGIDTIRQFITEKCLCPLGEEQVTAMSFSTNYATVVKWLEQTNEFLQIIRNRDDFPTDGFLDVRESLQRIGEDITTWFSEEEIAGLMKSLQTIRQIVSFLHNAETSTGYVKYPSLTAMADKIKVFPLLVEKADSILDKAGQVKDSASRQLTDIRKNKAEAVKAITRHMQVAIRNAEAEGLIGKDVQPSMRDGHMLIPVNAANKRKIKGVVHDGSGSGKTVFIEPEAVAEASKRLRELESDERREVIKILIVFTDLVRPELTAIMHSYRFMGEIDFIRAKALFSARINGVKPIVENKQQIEWIKAIHPLLNISLLRQNKQAYPLDINLNRENRILIVSGANAGGKSLCLKTVTLLQYMLQCGLLIPVHESSQAGVFEHIFVDIGDGQSIENSLSTYTSHLTNMKFFVEKCNDRTLILIDEFGSGTEPQIGGAIAETLLDWFNRKCSFGIITTHFQNLKHFAYETDGIINGAMLYDAEHMQPLYRLSIGNPGSAFAIEVARRIGLPEDIIVDSSAKIGEEFINMDNLLQSIARDKIYWEDRRREIEKNEAMSTEITVSDKETQTQSIDKQKIKSDIIEKGDSVRLNGQTATGVVLEIQGKQVTVAFGSLKSTVALNRLQLINKK
ncbi:MAG: DNA mismatch repair protein MutS [Tannerella sp.]|nr:DNA mismatch repair protein MutS [Tannerella sp.]